MLKVLSDKLCKRPSAVMRSLAMLNSQNHQYRQTTCKFLRSLVSVAATRLQITD